MGVRGLVLCAVVFGSACLLAGCGAGQVSDAQQQSKAKAMNDIAKEDPNYAANRDQHGGSGR